MATPAPYNPFAVSKIKNKKEDVDRTFGPRANGQIAQEIYRRNPDLYFSLRRDAQVLGYVGDPGYVTQAAVDSLRMNQQQAPISDETIQARARFSKEDCERIYKAGPTIGEGSPDWLRQNRPEEYRLLKLAAESHGVIAKSSVEVRVAPKRSHVEPTPQPDDSFLLTNEQCDKLYLPHGHRCASPENFGHLVELSEQIRNEIKNEATAAMAAVAAEK